MCQGDNTVIVHFNLEYLLLSGNDDLNEVLLNYRKHFRALRTNTVSRIVQLIERA